MAASLSAGAAYALYTAAASRLVGRGVTGARAMALTFAIGGLLLAIAVVGEHLPPAAFVGAALVTVGLAVAGSRSGGSPTPAATRGRTFFGR